MKKSHVLKSAATLAGACIVGAGLTGFAATDAAETNAVDAVAAVQQVAPGAVSDVAASLNADADTAVLSQAPEGGAVRVPHDPSEGVRVITPGDTPDLTIGLPFADQASDAGVSQKSGVVVYDNNNGSSTIPVAHSDGVVQISTVIETASAPRAYSYPIALPGGANLSLNEDGSVTIASPDESYQVGIAAPWAKDANGDAVSTHYEVAGDVLTQIVEFDTATAFPVVADPSVITTTYTYSRADVERMWNTYQTMGRICNLIPGLNYMATLLCPGGARLQEALNSAHYQKKRVKATFYNCGFTYCNYYEYRVVS